MLDFAIHLASFGWAMHPVHGIVDGECTCALSASCRSAGKHPVLPDWVSAATTDVDILRSYPWQDCNLGVVPRGFTILDFDGPEGAGLLQRMSALLPDLPDDTPIARTGSGGYHVFIGGEAKTRTKLLPGLDIRGLGGQAVLPPSAHYSGQPYRWMNPPKGFPPPAPDWLAVAQGEIPDELQPSERVDLAKLKGRWKKIAKKVLKGEAFAEEGERNSLAAKIAGAITRRWPYADIDQVVDLFRESLEVMGEPTPDQFRGQLQRFALAQREELERRPRIIVTTDIDDMLSDAISAVSRRALDIGIYTRGGQLTRVKPSENLPDDVLRGETPRAFEELERPNLLAHLATCAQWIKIKGDDPVNSYPPPSVVDRFLHCGFWEGLPHAERIVEGQSLRPDGTIFEGGGYDRSTGTIGLGHADHTPPMSVDEALSLLLGVVVDFPFLDEAHRSAWLASVLTGVAQGVFRGPSPLFLIDANVRSAGKSLLAEVAILIASGRSPSRATVGQDNIEDRKQITSLAVDGAQCILIDNISGLFGTAKLCEALTLHDSSWSDRILGRSKTWGGLFKPTWWATANNVRLQPDVARRTCYIRLNSPLERPELRGDFQKSPLMSWVYGTRVELYRAALSLLYHHMASGERTTLAPWGTYEGWSEIVRQTLVHYGLPDPAETRAALEIADEEHSTLRGLLTGLRALHRERFSPADVIHIVYEPQTLTEMSQYEELRGVLDAGCVQRGTTPTPQSVGKMFARYRDRVVDGLRLRKIDRSGSYWTVEAL